MARQEPARYLRDRRACLRPHEIGLTATGTARRTPGLRREEVAELAHMSVDYYTRLEQARGPRPSARILDALAQALLGGGTTNLARRRFLGQGRMYESSSAEEFGHIVVARLRRAADRYPHDPQLTALLAELHAGSEEFRQIWATRPVHAPGHRTKTLDHPETGTLRVNCDVLLVPEDDQEVVLITADPGSPAARSLHRLARQAA
ncbi:helix-turn-helix transcriptional regulator [Nonomuraea sp. NPDC000554]|uniref:helix-turn-helix transcriptional regulator n=1 Tax=Nonomuraea sp. NPDC000554 TaxID=3154259 RepID=UPI00331FE4D4